MSGLITAITTKVAEIKHYYFPTAIEGKNLPPLIWNKGNDRLLSEYTDAHHTFITNAMRDNGIQDGDDKWLVRVKLPIKGASRWSATHFSEFDIYFSDTDRGRDADRIAVASFISRYSLTKKTIGASLHTQFLNFVPDNSSTGSQ
ncbi:hypothetical protein D5018_21140 [Parashewanella curva]|uniref:Uncharacterized protein n=1 Tax=Parashewanella curva TaxID=2338552 RepID=A0A3L8PQS9_9GAMM|nr:hypothetical protein [Parashewanella curva]RLV57705.1 hypothetical protein D5018_21140 [Parashewanella curva]